MVAHNQLNTPTSSSTNPASRQGLLSGHGLRGGGCHRSFWTASPSSPNSRFLGLALVPALALLLIGSGSAFLAESGSFSSGTASTAVVDAMASSEPATGSSVTGTIPATLGAAASATPSTFWSVDAQTRCATCIYTNSTVRTFLNETPFTWVRYGAGTDSCNGATNTEYSSNGVASTGCGSNVTALKNWCDSLATPCHAIVSLPGENNNSAEDAAIAKYVVNTIGFQPSFWAVGNEPTGWTHYGIPWSSWRTADSSAATPLAYAFDVKAAIAAVLAVDPAAKFIGLESACSCNTVWFQDVAKIDGSLISAIAYHSYPSTGATTPTLTQFYEPLTGSSNLTSTYTAVRALITGLCTGCATMPIFVNEYNAGPGAAPSSLGGSYANAVFLAASVTQALRTNISQLTVFNLQTQSTTTLGYALLSSTGTVGPTGTLYSKVLPHLAIGSVFSARVASPLPNLWSVVTSTATSESLLVVNTNLTESVTLATNGSFVAATTGTSYQWSPSLSAPAVLSGVTLGSYTVPAQGILLLTVSTGTGSGYGTGFHHEPLPVPPSRMPGGLGIGTPHGPGGITVPGIVVGSTGASGAAGGLPEVRWSA
jgi:hypothetical protein